MTHDLSELGWIIKPVTPAEVRKHQLASASVVLAVNELICERIAPNGEVIFTETALADRINLIAQNYGYPDSEIVKLTKSWRELRQVFREAGWYVSYDKDHQRFTFQPKTQG